MPKHNLVKIQLPMDKPDCCADCPLCGLIPKEQRLRNSKESCVCLGTQHALTGRGIHVHASLRDANHPLRRPCDHVWDSWMTLPGRRFPLNIQHYTMYKMPFDQIGQMKITFHKRTYGEEN